MIIPTQPPSSYDEDQDQTLPPPYQESAPSSQRSVGGRRSSSLYAPSVSTRSDLPREERRASGPSPEYPNEKSLPLLPKEKEERPAQRAFDVFSSMVWGTTPTASTSRSQNPASASHTSLKQDPLDPAPDAFTRPAPKNYAYLPFQPMTMLGISANITDGFPMIPPPINPEDERSAGKANPQHPFVTHDITEEDWLK